MCLRTWMSTEAKVLAARKWDLRLYGARSAEPNDRGVMIRRVREKAGEPSDGVRRGADSLFVAQLVLSIHGRWP
jgi:hypothetical protein